MTGYVTETMPKHQPDDIRLRHGLRLSRLPDSFSDAWPCQLPEQQLSNRNTMAAVTIEREGGIPNNLVSPGSKTIPPLVHVSYYVLRV